MRDSVEDLSALSRRGELDAAEQRRLQLALQSSSEARLLHRAGLDLDLAGSMLPGDDALAERVKRRVLARVLPAAAPRRRRLLPWGIAAAVACKADTPCKRPTHWERRPANLARTPMRLSSR